jgi:LDH2 family malate/lactate/ureidoglycolate dehydrogenase
MNMVNKQGTLVDHTELFRFISQVLEAVGTPPAGASEMAKQMVASDLAGHESHGIRRLREYAYRARDGFVNPAANPTIDLDTGSLVSVDGQSNYGHLVMPFVTDLVIERTRAHGIAAVTVKNCDPAGRFADFCDHAANEGIAVFMFMNCGGGAIDVAPPGGAEARLATNPIAAGVPREGAPNLVMDMATSAVAKGRLSDAQERDTEIGDDWLNQSGVLLPLGGVKGFALAVIAEAVAGSLSSAGTVGPEKVDAQQGVLAIGIDIQRFLPLAEFKKDVAKFATHLKETPLEPGAAEIRMPGESTAINTQARLKSGITIHPVIWERVFELAEVFAVRLPESKDH